MASKPAPAPVSGAEFPPPPVNTIDWNNVGFKVREVNGHIESHYTSQTQTWSAPTFMKSPHLSIHGMSPALNYGQQAYEGLKAFRHPGNKKITIFRPHRNATRLSHSATSVSIPPVPESLFLTAVELAVATNAEFVPPHESGAAMYIRPLVFGSSPQLGLSAPEEYTFVVFVMPTGVYHGVSAVDALILEDFDRAAPMGTGSVKVGGNYAPVLRHSARARGEGFGITLHLDSRTREEVDEFSTSAFIGVKTSTTAGSGSKGGGREGEVTLVQPDSPNVIDSVTAASVLEIGKGVFGWAVEKRRVPYEELRGGFDEVLAAGTAAALVPVRSISRKSRGEKFNYECGGEEAGGGEVCVKLLQTLKGIQCGKIEDPFGWNYTVRAPPVGFIEDVAGGKEESGIEVP